MLFILLWPLEVEHMLCQVVKNCTIISCRHGGFPLAKMEHLFVRVFRGSPQFWLMGGDVLNERQRLRDAVGFNKIASRFARGGFILRWRGQKSTIFVSRKKTVDACQALVTTVGCSWNKAVVEKLEMTVGLVQKNILLIVKTAWARSWKTLPPTMASNKIQANHGKNDRSRYSTNIDTLAILKTYMPPRAYRLD